MVVRPYYGADGSLQHPQPFKTSKVLLKNKDNGILNIEGGVRFGNRGSAQVDDVINEYIAPGMIESQTKKR